jgi:hypothetical protein
VWDAVVQDREEEGCCLLVITNGYVVNQELIANLAPIVYSTRVPYILNKSTEIQGVGSDFFLICCRTPVKLSHF